MEQRIKEQKVIRPRLKGEYHWAHGQLKKIPSLLDLKGKNLACWCKEGEPCHADILLKLANEIINY